LVSIMQVLMKGHEQRSEHLCSVIPVDYTSYIIQFTVGKQKWEVRKRYSEFVKLYNLLESKVGFEAIDKLPEIPPKKFLLALSPSLIKERQNAFNEFLKEVVKNPEICQSADFIDFVQMPVDVSAADAESKWQTSSFGEDSD